MLAGRLNDGHSVHFFFVWIKIEKENNKKIKNVFSRKKMFVIYFIVS